MKSAHKRANDLLTAIVLLLGLYIVLTPFLPAIGRGIKTPDVAMAAPAGSRQVIPKDPLLKIPRLGMKENINTGPTPAELNKGVWLIPRTSTPDKQSNTVIAGHRFTYAGPAVFYFLDRLRVGDKIYLDWQGAEYSYKVSLIRVVPPTETSVQNASDKPELTLYTCTPLLTAKNRLVIVAPLEGVKT